MKCSCGNDRFYAGQKCLHNIITDELGVFLKDKGVYKAENPYGPYECTKCKKEYKSLAPPTQKLLRQQKRKVMQ